MNYSIPSIPTNYRGRQYRSRLEAKWAAFFDLCEWRYEYEPIDLNGWFPDFALFGDNGNMILVEVKPVTNFPTDVAEKMEEAVGGAGHELLILGQGPFYDFEDGCIGWLMEIREVEVSEVEWEREHEWGIAVWGQWESSDKPGFCHESGQFTDRISGAYDGGCFGSDVAKNIRALWNGAGNLVQYRPPK